MTHREDRPAQLIFKLGGAGLALAFVISVAGVVEAAAVRVELVKSGDAWQLLRDGKPYFIKGAGGDASKAFLVECGGNSFRTWGADNLDDQLNEAQKLGLTVTVGIWLGHKRHGFDYHNDKMVAEQLERARQSVLRYKDHPAVLLWSVGNEMENYEKAGDPAVWKAVEDIAAMIKKLDPNHPTMTVVAEIGGDKVRRVHEHCPDIDIIGINTYGGGPSIPERYRSAGGVKPYVITEFGPPGTWEIRMLAIGAAPELSSTEKAAFYRETYTKAVAGARGMCLGSYVFAWGFKREATATWYGMFLPDGAKLEVVDTMSELWTGKQVAHPCPKIRSLKLAEGDGNVAAGGKVNAALDAAGVNGDPVRVSWELHRDWFQYETGGDNMPETPQFPEAIVSGGDTGAELKMPEEGGGYRLYAIVRSARGGGAVANVPLLAGGDAPKPKARKAALPLVILGAGQDGSPYVPSGWMGNHGAIGYTGDCEANPHEGKTCVKLEYRSAEGWAGIVWQSPANDWGDKPGGFNLTGARKLAFWARGDEGGEKVEFFFGIIKADKPFPDSASGRINVTLAREWQKREIDLTGKDLSRIKSGFGWSLGGQGKPVTFYLDDIRYE